MKVEFSPNQVILPASPGAAARPATSAGSADADSLVNTAALNDKLNGLPLSRPDKVSGAITLVARQHYPPDDLADRIATLLAISLSKT
jgi:hypothetical protein